MEKETTKEFRGKKQNKNKKNKKKKSTPRGLMLFLSLLPLPTISLARSLILLKIIMEQRDEHAAAATTSVER